ncbi:integral membrane protein [Stemphylium lycopersici]|nr:integral membrane protein [Stemphylium lycopersici]
MSTGTIVIPDPRSLPDNANLPNINQPATILGTTIAFLSLAVITLSLRLWVRIKDRLWSWDDLFLVLAAMTSFVADIMHIYSTNCAYTASATLIKLAILFQYLRLFAETAPTTTASQYRFARRLIWGMIALCSTWGLTFLLLAVFSCNPIAKNWNPTLEGRCIGWGTKEPHRFFAMFMGHAVSNTFLDTLVLLLPVPFLTTLRIAVHVMEADVSGLTINSVVILATARMIALAVNRAGTVPILDMSYHVPVVYILGILEVNLAIVTASIPIFWPVIAELAGNKIFVVNEVEIHVENVARQESFESNDGITLTDRKGSSHGDNKMGVITTISDHLSRKSGEKPTTPDHTHESSTASSTGRSMGLSFSGRKHSNASSVGRTFADLGPRPSQDSSRNLYQIPSHEVPSLRSLTQNDGDDWFTEMDRANSPGQSATTVQISPVPYGQNKPTDNK